MNKEVLKEGIIFLRDELDPGIKDRIKAAMATGDKWYEDLDWSAKIGVCNALRVKNLGENKIFPDGGGSLYTVLSNGKPLYVVMLEQAIKI